MTAEEVLTLARSQNMMIATAESCTGGLIAAALTAVAGSSDVFERGFVTYSNEAKEQMLGVPKSIIKSHGAVSEDVARAMAEGAIAHSDAHLAVAVTGIAGPGGSDHKPEGRVCFGLSERGKPSIVESVEFGAIGRANVRQATVKHALGLLAQALS